MQKLRNIFGSVLALGIVVATSTCFAADRVDTNVRRTILLWEKISPLRVLLGDTVFYTRDTVYGDDALRPGALPLYSTAIQDTNFVRLFRLGIPPATLFAYHVGLFAEQWKLLQKQAKRTPVEIARDNLSIPAEFYRPSGQQMAMYQYGLMQAQRIPTGLPRTPGTGFEVPLGTIGALLGITEDLSPIINYSIDYATDVEVVVYSSNAVVIRTVHKGRQIPGTYEYEWNGLDENGRKMPGGDYVFEARIGKERLVRKRIQIP